MRYKVIHRILTENGWIIVRQKGSHVQYKKAGESFLTTVPNQNGRDISIGVLSKLEKGTGLSFKKR